MYKPGMKIQLDADMNDEASSAPTKGCVGTVQYIDGLGTIHMRWENGSTLGLIVGEDYFHVVG